MFEAVAILRQRIDLRSTRSLILIFFDENIVFYAVGSNIVSQKKFMYFCANLCLLTGFAILC